MAILSRFRLRLDLLLVTILTAFLPQTLPAQTSAATASSPRGVYLLLTGNAIPNPDDLRISSLSGVKIRTGWRQIEREEGKFDWSYIDESITMIKKANKTAMLTVIPGVGTPDWVYDQGAKEFEFVDQNPYHRTQGERLRIPIPWDETFLNQWTRFIAALGKKYNSESAIILIQMAGPAATSSEMHLPKGPEARARWEKAGYSREKLVNAWKRVIDAYLLSFPDKSMAINIAIPLYNDGALEEILAYGVSKYGRRFIIQGNWLSARTAEDFLPYRLIKEYSKKTIVGFEMVGPSGQGKGAMQNKMDLGQDQRSPKQSRPDLEGGRLGGLQGAIEKGLAAGASYLIIYPPDLLDPKLAEDIQYATGRLGTGLQNK